MQEHPFLQKIIPTLKLYPEAVIVTADDDVYYSPNWLELLYKSFIKWPNFIHCHRDTKFFIENGEFKYIAGGKEKYLCPTYLHKLVGIGGVLYPPHSLHPDVLNEKLFTTLAPTNDDIWLWLMAVRNNTKILVVEGNIPQPKYVEGTQSVGLTHINDGGPKLFEVDFYRVLQNFKELEEKLFAEFEFVTQYEQLAKTRGKNYDFYASLETKRYPAALAEWYHTHTKDWLNLDAPLTFNDKLQWMKLYDSTPLKTKLADKYLVREWIAEKIGEEYLVPLLGVWDSFDEINFDELPDQFVLKANHGSGWNIIVKDKQNFDKEAAREKFAVWMKKNYAFVFGLELHYMNIPPKIIAEKYIEQADQVYDYKFMCFNGKVQFIWVDTDRFTDHKRTFFDRDWNRLNIRQVYKNASYEIPKPFNFEKMMRFSELLSKDFALVRVDFYEIGEKLYFGEMTFTSVSGYEIPEPREMNYLWGKLIKLPPKAPIPKRSF